ncbi:hypothetical protein [Roseomonas chloroacetimidivorans]
MRRVMAVTGVAMASVPAARVVTGAAMRRVRPVDPALAVSVAM